MSEGAVVRRAIVDGVPFPDLEDESILHVAAADALARVAGAARPPPSSTAGSSRMARES